MKKKLFLIFNLFVLNFNLQASFKDNLTKKKI